MLADVGWGLSQVGLLGLLEGTRARRPGKVPGRPGAQSRSLSTGLWMGGVILRATAAGFPPGSLFSLFSCFFFFFSVIFPRTQ